MKLKTSIANLSQTTFTKMRKGEELFYTKAFFRHMILNERYMYMHNMYIKHQIPLL